MRPAARREHGVPIGMIGMIGTRMSAEAWQVAARMA
jgi:hypothetical protein